MKLHDISLDAMPSLGDADALRTKIANLENVIKAQDQCIQAYRDLVEILKKGTQHGGF